MKTVREVIRRAPVWVNPQHTVESAIILMRGHEIGALPVLDGSRLVGMVLYSHLLGVDIGRRVDEVMLVGIPAVTPEMSVREAASAMARARLGRLPVLEGGRLVGVITDGDLLPEVGRSFDPTTELPWADSLREWAIYHLQRGQEITVLFIDLDDFGQFNKRFGHIVGDEVLQAVARTLRAAIDPDTDFLCRYAGDEFCIVTLRSAEEAAELVARLSRRITEIELPSLHGERIACTIGKFGGKRTKEREHVHYAATLNSLINLASRDCTAHKSGQQTALEQGAEGIVPRFERSSRLRLERIWVRWRTGKAHVRVELEIGSHSAEERSGQATLRIDGLNRYAASASAETDELGAIRLVAETTVCALRPLLPDGYDVTLLDVVENQIESGQHLITTVGQFHTGTQAIPIAGSALVGEDPYRAAASSVLAAVNRPLGKVLAKNGR